MPNAILGVNIGPDLSVTFRASTGENFPAETLGHLTNFSPKTKDTVVTTKTITNKGKTLVEVIPHDGTIKTDWARMNSALTKVMYAYRQNFFQGIRTFYTIQAQVRNRDGSVDTYLFRNCKPADGDLGDFKPDSDVKQSLDWHFDDYTITSGGSGGLSLSIGQ